MARSAGTSGARFSVDWKATFFYATLYGRSPELINEEIAFSDGPEYPSENLDRAFRKIAWQSSD